MQTDPPNSPYPGLTLRLTAWLGLATFLFDLILSESTIWAGGARIQSTVLLALLVEPVAKLIAGAAWQHYLAGIYAALWLLHYLVFVAAFWLCSRDSADRSGRRPWLLALQLLVALAGDGQFTFGVAAQLAFYYELRTVLPALLGLLVLRCLSDLPFTMGLTGYPALPPIEAFNFIAYHVRDNLVVFAMGYIARIAWQSRRRLMDANAELRATEQRLAETERDAERVRIARDLHDTVGHQLTAINLHLDLGMRRAQSDIPQAIHRARELAGAVLAKLRVAVSRESTAGEDGVPAQLLPVAEIGLRYRDMFAWFGVGTCLYSLILDGVMLSIGNRQVLTFDVIYPLCAWMVRAALPAGAALEPTLHTVYGWSWVLFYCAFAAAFWRAAKLPAAGPKLTVLWWVQIVLAVVWHGQYLYAVIPQVAYRLPLRRALPWFVIVLLASASVIGPFLAGWTPFPVEKGIGTWYFPIKVLRDEAVFFVSGMLARMAASQRAKLAATNAELHEARSRLAESARVLERLRIAGQLNQMLGHDLAALNLQLDLGVRQGGPQLADSVGVAHQASRQLFDDIRSAIERDKAGRGTDLRTALETLCAGVPQPRVSVNMDHLPPMAPDLAHCLYCCVQEGITNAVRHAQAATLAIELKVRVEGIAIVIEDDGCGMRTAEEGNGLRGMRARVAQYGGDMRVEQGAGCRIEIHIPVAALAQQFEGKTQEKAA